MKEKEKYYAEYSSKRSGVFIIVVGVLLIGYCIFNGIYESQTFYFILATIFTILWGLSLYIMVETKNKQFYLFYEGETLYKRVLFRTVKQVDMTNGYISKTDKKGETHYIVVNDDNGKGSMLIGRDYKNIFPELLKLLELKSNKADNLS